MLARSVGYVVKLQPTASGPAGVTLDDDWLIASVGDDAVTLEQVKTKSLAHVGLDSVFGFVTDAHGRMTPNEKRGFLQLLVQIAIQGDGSVNVKPIPPPRIATASPSPLAEQTERQARKEYYSLWSSARGAIRALLVAGDMTGEQVFQYLVSNGEPGDREDLRKIAGATNLVKRSFPEDTREVRIAGYTGPYTINLKFQRALEKLVVDDPDLPAH